MPKIILDISEEQNNFFTSYLIQSLYFATVPNAQPSKQVTKITTVNKKRGNRKK